MLKNKQIYLKEGVQVTKDGLIAYSVKENVGSVKQLSINDPIEVSRLVEACAKKSKKMMKEDVESLMKAPNTAMLKIIKCGWSINGNYYSPEVLSELPDVIEAQGPIQFKNHLEEGSKLDRDWEEIISYTKAVWYDEVTESVYAIVRFPREKQDTGWIFNLIQDDPEMVGVSIDSAVYVQENFEADGQKGDKIVGWAYFNSADYVIFPSAGGVAVEASKVSEKIKNYKEKAMLKPKKENIDSNVAKLKAMKESIDSFLTRYYDSQAYHEIQAVVESLSNFLMGIWWDVYDEETDAKTRIAAIKTAFEQASAIMQNLEFWKNPGAEYDASGKVISKQEAQIKPISLKPKKESLKMTLDELKAQHPEAFVALIAEAEALAKAKFVASDKDAIAKLEGQVKDLDSQIVTVKAENQSLTEKVSEFEKKESIAKKKEMIEKAIDDAGFTAEQKELAITSVFRKTLESLSTPEEVKEYIDERKALLANVKPAVKTETVMEGAKTPATDDDASFKALAKKAFEEISN